MTRSTRPSRLASRTPLRGRQTLSARGARLVTRELTRVRYGFMERDFRARVEYTSPNLSTNLNPGQDTREQTTVRSKTDSCHDTTTKCFGPVTQLSAHGTNHGAASRRPIFHSRKPVRSVRATRGSAVGGVVPAQVTRKSRLPRENFSRWSSVELPMPDTAAIQGQAGRARRSTGLASQRRLQV